MQFAASQHVPVSALGIKNSRIGLTYGAGETEAEMECRTSKTELLRGAKCFTENNIVGNKGNGQRRPNGHAIILLLLLHCLPEFFFLQFFSIFYVFFFVRDSLL